MKVRVALCLSLACFALPASAQNPASSVASVSPSIVLVRVAGPWEAGGQAGFSRLVATGSGNRVSLSVEWIGSQGTVVQAIPLQAPPGAEQLPVARIRNQNSGAETSVFFDTPAGDTFVLAVGAPGEASFGPATN
jgi:hypothetical protein